MLRCAVTAFGILVACGAAGCASLTTDHSVACSARDWDRFGENDGRLGISTQDRLELFENCNEIGTPADVAAYEVGRARGVLIYCTVDNGFEVGRTGREYQGVCRDQAEVDFLQGYQAGLTQYDAYRPATVGYPDVSVGLGFGFGSYNYYGYRPSYGYRGYHRGHRKHYSKKRHGNKHHGNKHHGDRYRANRPHANKHANHRPRQRNHGNRGGRRKHQFSER